MAGIEFDRVRVRTDDGRLEDFMLTNRESGTDGFRAAVFSGLPAKEMRRLDVSLGTPEGRTLASRFALLDGLTDRTVTVLFTRSCEDLSCSDDQVCVRGRCAPGTCVEGTEPSCPAPECARSADCEEDPIECVQAICAVGSCLRAEAPGVCTESEYCQPDEGCRPRPSPAPDAGDGDAGGSPSSDGGASPTSDAGTDGGSPSDAGTDAGPTPGICTEVGPVLVRAFPAGTTWLAADHSGGDTLAVLSNASATQALFLDDTGAITAERALPERTSSSLANVARRSDGTGVWIAALESTAPDLAVVALNADGSMAGTPSVLDGGSVPGVAGGVDVTDSGYVGIALHADGSVRSYALSPGGEVLGSTLLDTAGTWLSVATRGERAWASWRVGTDCYVRPLDATGAPTSPSAFIAGGCWDPAIIDVGTGVVQAHHRRLGGSERRVRVAALDGTLSAVRPLVDVSEPGANSWKVFTAPGWMEGRSWFAWTDATMSSDRLALRHGEPLSGSYDPTEMIPASGTVTDMSILSLAADGIDGVDLLFFDDEGLKYARRCR